MSVWIDLKDIIGLGFLATVIVVVLVGFAFDLLRNKYRRWRRRP